MFKVPTLLQNQVPIISHDIYLLTHHQDLDTLYPLINLGTKIIF